MSETLKKVEPIFTDADWDFGTLDRAFEAIEDIAKNDLGLETYPNQIEIISTEQMLDAYSSHGMPLMYRHWSFGKLFAHHDTLYRKGYQGLAYEIVINSSPCISYLLEENTMIRISRRWSCKTAPATSFTPISSAGFPQII